MSTPTETSDSRVLGLLHQRGGMSISQLVEASEVTATAVRQRLNRLMAQGMVQRERVRNAPPATEGQTDGQAAKIGRGRPRHRYMLTEKARRQAGWLWHRPKT